MADKISPQEWRDLTAKKKTNKFRAVAKVYNGEKYHSTKEAEQAAKYDIARKAERLADRVVDVERQVVYSLCFESVSICKYILDFKVTYADGRIEFVDVKGYKKGTSYEMFKIKSRLMKAINKISIIEV